MKKIITTLFIVSSCLFIKPAFAEDPNVIVSKADKIRAPEGSYEFEAVITNLEGSEKKSESKYKVYVKDLDHSLVEFTAPASEKGKSLLMLADDLWIYLPNVKKPVRIPLHERLAGNVSNGDMARANFSSDYTSTLVGEETVGGKASFVLDLVAKSPNKTYNKIKYWVSKSDFKPVKAEYFTVSGRSLKVSTFEDFKEMGGAIRPTKLTFEDSMDKNKKSILIFNSITKKKLDDNMFTKDYMKTLE
ncbi:MAG: outer membrane lipoprotein-sorting protein [Deltaproteobacteria bacterium]|nr:outer membrane lipoprotein-sorting protein [Deltaproteobacteria bacterium]